MIRVTLRNPSKGQTPVNGVTDDINMDRVIYQYLGSLVKNTNLSSDYTSGKLPPAYMKFLDKFNDINIVKTNNGDLSQIPELSTWVTLDKYLGSLGISEEYLYDKDRVDIPAWLAIGTQGPYRVLVIEDTLEVLTIPSTKEVLISSTTTQQG